MSKFQQQYYKTIKWEACPTEVVNAVIDEIKHIASYELGKPLNQIKILDVGSGRGEYAIALAKLVKKVVGVEPFEDIYKISLINKQRSKSKAIFINSFIEDFNTNEKFDIALSLTTLEHMPKAEKSYAKVFALLTKGGVLYLTAPNKLWPYESHYRLYFLSWLPLPIANIYVKLMGHGESFTDSSYMLSYFGMRRLFNKFDCTYKFVLPQNLNSAYIGCGNNSFFYTLIKHIGIRLINRFSVFWLFSKGFIMLAKKN